MSATRLVTVAVGVVLFICAVAVASMGIPAIVGFLLDPDGFLAGVGGLFGGFLLVVGIAAATAGVGVLREARWAWQAAYLATALMLFTGIGGLSDSRPGSLPIVEVAVAFGGVVLAALLVARWMLIRDAERGDRGDCTR
jgi:hypothetical protein